MLASDVVVLVRLDRDTLAVYVTVVVDVDLIHGKEKGVQ